MNADAPGLYRCDSKYGNIIAELSSRGWVRENCDGDERTPISSQCNLLWLNLSQIKFAVVFDRFVNHFRGSQHLSNKVSDYAL